MQLKPGTEQALNDWLGPSSWNTPHDDDMDRWYDLISQYQRDHGYAIDEAALRQQIEHQVGGQFTDEENGSEASFAEGLAWQWTFWTS